MRDIREIWKNVDAVCFDVDSTVIRNEGIDELAEFCGKSDEVKAITRTAMSGKLEFREALTQRLEIISPSVMQIRAFIRNDVLKLTRNVRELIMKLDQKNIAIYLVSGGFRDFIAPLAAELKITQSNVFANKLMFYSNGEYAGFDHREPTSCSGGKSQVVKLLKEKYRYETVVMIGDGMTDAEASPPADAFIGFGGNVVRDEVRKKSNWYITDFKELIEIL